MKRLILAVTVTIAVLGACVYGNQQQALIESKTVVAYQVAYDGAMQVTFANGDSVYFEDMNEVLDHMDEIYNYNFITELEECYKGHPTVIKPFLIDLSIKMQRMEMFGVAEL